MTPAKPESRRPADVVNAAFHASYDGARRQAELEAPVLVVTVDALVLCRRQDRQVFTLSHGEFHAIKAAAHAPVAAFVALCDAGEGPLVGNVRDSLSGLGRAARAMAEGLEGRTDAVAQDTRDVLLRSVSFVDAAIQRGRGDRSALDAFALECGPVLMRLTDHGTRAQLTSLDAAAAEALDAVSAEERRALQVVVTGDHQARVRSLAMRYFQKRLGEAPGDENRVAFGEGVASVDEAIALVGTRRLDRAVAVAFFGDAKRLQRDVLGDAAAALLARTDLATIGD
jgi:hypothetical protein